VVARNKFRRLLLTLGALSDFGAELIAERDFTHTAKLVVSRLCEAFGAIEGVLLAFEDKPATLTSLAAQGFSPFPETARMPLLPRHVHALGVAPLPVIITRENCNTYCSLNGNFSPEIFRCLAPLRVGSKLVGILALGRREGDSPYGREELAALQSLSSYIALSLQNWSLKQSLEHRVAENLRLLGSLHDFYDDALRAFASAIDTHHVSIHGHSLRVGRYAAGIGDAIGLGGTETGGLKAAGYLHDIGKIAVSNQIFSKPSQLDEAEFKEMSDHTVVGHRIVSGVAFPWPRIPDVVRWHHERFDGSGYPDHLHIDEIPLAARIIGVADSFDAMMSERPYRKPLSLADALSQLVQLAPSKLDPIAVQALLVQVRRDAAGSNKTAFLDPLHSCNIGPTDVDHFASTLQHKLSNGRTYSC
jgi:HD domain/GAF domain